MSLKIDCKHEALLVQVHGDFDLVSAAEFRDKVDMALEDLGPKHLILDLSKVTFMDSSALGVILGRLRKIQSVKGRMFLIGVKPAVRKVLSLSGIMSLLTICQTEEQVFHQLGKGA
jgi:stage II sporulation protein AA (anti-sigma F factor antagonist)